MANQTQLAKVVLDLLVTANSKDATAAIKNLQTELENLTLKGDTTLGSQLGTNLVDSIKKAGSDAKKEVLDIKSQLSDLLKNIFVGINPTVEDFSEKALKSLENTYSNFVDRVKILDRVLSSSFLFVNS